MNLTNVTGVATSAVQSPSVADNVASTDAKQATEQSPVNSDVPILNPARHIDAALGLVVTETYNQAGTVVESYPTARALDHYKIYGLTETDQPAATSGVAV